MSRPPKPPFLFYSSQPTKHIAKRKPSCYSFLGERRASAKGECRRRPTGLPAEPPSASQTGWVGCGERTSGLPPEFYVGNRTPGARYRRRPTSLAERNLNGIKALGAILGNLPCPTPDRLHHGLQNVAEERNEFLRQ